MKNKKLLIITLAAIFVIGAVVAALLLIPGSPLSVLTNEPTCQHQYSLFTMSGTPTYNAPATATRTCSICKFTDTQKVYPATGLEYEEDEGIVTITSANGFSGDVLYIAAKQKNGDPVHAIGESVFSETNIAAVYIEEGIEILGDYAFSHNPKLRQVVIPASIAEYGNYTFAGNAQLTSVDIHKDATKLGTNQFYECAMISEIVLPDGIEEIPIGVFFGCKKLNKIQLPANLTAIGVSAFHGCESLSEIQLPETVKELYPNSFAGCTGLTTMVLPSLTKLSYHTFLGCTGLKKVFLSGSITEIEVNGSDGPFFNCSKDLVLYTDAAEAPAGWDAHFNNYNSAATDDDGGELNDEAYFNLDVVYNCPLSEFKSK